MPADGPGSVSVSFSAVLLILYRKEQVVINEIVLGLVDEENFQSLMVTMHKILNNSTV